MNFSTVKNDGDTVWDVLFDLKGVKGFNGLGQVDRVLEGRGLDSTAVGLLCKEGIPRLTKNEGLVYNKNVGAVSVIDGGIGVTLRGENFEITKDIPNIKKDLALFCNPNYPYWKRGSWRTLRVAVQKVTAFYVKKIKGLET